MSTTKLVPGLNGYQHCFWLAAQAAMRQAAAAMISITDNPYSNTESIQQDPVAIAQSLAEFEKALEAGLSGFTSAVTNTPYFVGTEDTPPFVFRSVPRIVFCSKNASNANPAGES